jgi:hypothetical protein
VTSFRALALLIAIGIVVLVIALVGGPSKPTSVGSSASAHQPRPSRSAGGPTPTSKSAPVPSTASVPAPSVQSRQSAAPSTTPTSAPVPGLAFGQPVITSLDPANAAPGQQIAVMGANFMSSNGSIVATFNGQVAPTRCPTQTSCTVTVPPASGSPQAVVTIATSNGTSNVVSFTYGGQ